MIFSFYTFNFYFVNLVLYECLMLRSLSICEMYFLLNYKTLSEERVLPSLV